MKQEGLSHNNDSNPEHSRDVFLSAVSNIGHHEVDQFGHDVFEFAEEPTEIDFAQVINMTRIMDRMYAKGQIGKHSGHEDEAVQPSAKAA